MIPLNCVMDIAARCAALMAAWLLLTTAAVAAQEPPCVDPVSHGAVANDAQDDRDAFQAAINAAISSGASVCIGAGNWDLKRNEATGPAGLASLRVDGAKRLEIRGAGAAATRLRMMGAGARRNWRLIDIAGGSTDVGIRDLSLDGALRSDTAEQTHLLHISGPASRITAERLTLSLPALADEAGGDCVRIVGGWGALVTGVTLRHVVGLSCNRSFVAVQRGVRRLRIEASRSIVVGDQAIDFEPSGGPHIADVQIVNSTLARGPAAQGQYTVAIGGEGVFVARRITMRSTRVFDGGVHVIDADGVALNRVDIRGAASSPGLALHIRRRVGSVAVDNSQMTRHAAAGIGPVVSIHHQSGQHPRSVRIGNSTIVQPSGAPLIETKSLTRFALVGSMLVYARQTDAAPAISAAGVIAPIHSISIVGNRIHGAAQGALLVNQSMPSRYPHVVRVTGNRAVDLTRYGVLFLHGLPAAAPHIEGNDFGTVAAVLQ